MGKGKSSARAARRNGGGTGTSNSPKQKAGSPRRRKRSDDLGGRVCPRTERRACEGRQEQQQRRPGERYPFYYVTQKLRWSDGQGRRREKRICDDCHNNEWLARELRWLREQGYGRDDAVVVQAEEVLADAAAATAVQPDRSASGAAIEAARGMLVHDADGGLCEVELAETRLLPDGEDQLRKEIALGVLAAANRGDYDRTIYRARAERHAAAATAVDPAALARLVAQATGGSTAPANRFGGQTGHD